MAIAIDTCSCKCNPCVCLPPAGTDVGCLPVSCVPRPCFFDGQLIGADDLNAAVGYARNQEGLLARFLSGFGILGGLKVDVTDPARRHVLATGTLAALSNNPQIIAGSKVVVSPGVAIDALGRKLVLCQTATLDLQQLAQQASQGELKSGTCETLLGGQCSVPTGTITVTEFFLVAEFQESASRPAPQFSAGGPCDPSPTCAPSRKDESVKFSLIGCLPPEYQYTGCLEPTGFTLPDVQLGIQPNANLCRDEVLAFIDRVQNDLAQICCARPGVVLAKVLLTREPGTLKSTVPSAALYTLLSDAYPCRRPIYQTGLFTKFFPNMICPND